MKGFLVDTNCISELIRTNPDTSVVGWFEAVDESLIFISVLTIGEISKGINLLSDSTRRLRLQTWLEVDLRSRFQGRILAIDEAVASKWGTLAAETQRQ